MTSEQIGSLLTVVVVLLLLWVRDRVRKARQNKLQRSFLEKYEPVVREHGELFEKLVIPMDEDDRRKVKSYYNVFFVFFSAFGVLLMVILFYDFPDSTKEYFQSAGLAGVVITACVMAYNARKKTLANNKKTIIKGVITNKAKTPKKNGYTYKIQISSQEDVTVNRREYKKYDYGDVIGVELLGNPGGTITNRKISLLGKVKVDAVNEAP